MHVGNTDANSHSENPPEKCLQESERVKKKMYLKACLQHHRQLSPFVASVGGLLGVEAMAILQRIAICLTTKWRQPYSQMCGYIKSRIAITLLQDRYRCIWGSRVLAHKIIVHLSQWENNTGLNLFM